MAKKILIVDDELDLVTIVKDRLEKSGYEVLCVDNGEKALNHLKKDIPDLILLDLLLPAVRGEEVCKQIKCDARLKHIPIIVFTASASDIQKLSKEIGADDYIMKPYDPKELLAKIEAII